MPTKVYSEPDCIWNHREEIAALGKKALIITGHSSAQKNGSLADIRKALSDKDTSCVLFQEIEENPSVETVMKAAKLGRDAGADFVIGIGGGSALDAAKAIALMVQNRDSDASVLFQPLPLRALPVVAVPTTCGTGSEVTQYAILTRHDIRTKQGISHSIFPVLSFVDYRYLKGAPVGLITSTAIDALAHFIESYFNTRATTYSRMLCLHGLAIWGTEKKALLTKEISDEALRCLLDASTYAGMAIAHTSTTIPHGASYYLTYEKQIPHGLAVGTYLPSYLKLQTNQEEVVMLVQLMGFTDLEDFETFIRAIVGTIQLPEEEIHTIEEQLIANKRKLPLCPFETSEKNLRFMVSSSLDKL